MTGFLVIRSYFRKSRLQVTVISLMLVIASLLSGLTLVLGMDYRENFHRTHDALHTEHLAFNMINPLGADSQKLMVAMDADERVAEYEITEMLIAQGSCAYGEDGMLLAYFTPIRISDAERRTIGKFEITDSSDAGDGYLPYIFKANGFCDVGDEYTVTLGNITWSFLVKGFYNNLTTGSVNCHRNVALLLTDEKYAELEDLGLPHGFRVSARLTEPEKKEYIETELVGTLSESDNRLVFFDSLNTDKLAANRYISEAIFVGVLTAAAIVIIFVLLAIIAVSLSNYIKENLRNLGILKSIGYVSGNILIPIVMSLLALSLVMSVIGYSLSYLLLPTINGILEAQSGIRYQIRFLMLPGAITVGIMVLLVLVTSVCSMMKIRRILPIMAIRPVHHTGRGSQVLPLQKTRLNLNLALGMKSIFSDVKKYVIFLVSSCLITVMLCVAAYCYDSILNQPDNIIRYTVGSMADVMISVSASDENELLERLDHSGDVNSRFLMSISNAGHVGGGRIDLNIRDSEGHRQCGHLLYQGSLPASDSELAVNFCYAEKYDLEVGDRMTLKIGSSEETYTICGLIQDAYCSGRNLTMTREGFEKLFSLDTLSYMVILNEGKEIESFIEALNDTMPSVSAVNYRRYIDGMTGTYITMLDALIVVIIIVSLAIAVLVLSIIVNMILFNKRREHGILKSLGFVTPQIVFQTAVSFVPVALCGSLIGLIISRDNISALFSAFVRNIGIASLGNSIGIPYLILCGVSFAVFTFAVTCLLSAKVRKTAPHDLFNNE